MSDDLQKIAAHFRLSPEQARRVSDSTKEVDSFLSTPEGVAQMKLAGIDWTSAALGSAAALAINNVGGDILGNAYDSLKHKLTRGSNLNTMLKHNPDVAKHEDREKVKLIFNSLNRLNPNFASDPFISGSYTRNMLFNEGPAVEQSARLVSAHSTMKDSRKIRGLDQITEVLIGSPSKTHAPTRTMDLSDNEEADRLLSRAKSQSDIAKARSEIEHRTDIRPLEKRKMEKDLELMDYHTQQAKSEQARDPVQHELGMKNLRADVEKKGLEIKKLKALEAKKWP